MLYTDAIGTYGEAKELYNNLTRALVVVNDPIKLRTIRTVRVEIWNIINQLEYIRDRNTDDILNYFINSQYLVVSNHAKRQIKGEYNDILYTDHTHNTYAITGVR